MRRYIVLLLITGIVWAQTDFDKLVLKDGTIYLGEYSKTEGGKVFFIPEGANSPTQVVPVKLIKKLQLKDGYFIIVGGRNRLTLEEYQKFSSKEKGIYDAKSKNLGKWTPFAPICSTIPFFGFAIYQDFMGESPILLGVSSAASLTINYLVINNNEKINFPKSIMTDSEKEIYKQAYSKKLQKRKFKYIVGSTIVAGVAVSLMAGNSSSGFFKSGLDMGPQPPGPY